MISRVLIIFIPFSLAMTACIWVNVLIIMMVGEINRKKSDSEQVNYLGYGLTKVFLVFSEYRNAYPSGKLAMYAKAAISFMFVGLIATAICLILANPIPVH